MLIFHDRDTLLHETIEFYAAKVHPALESPARIRSILDSISHSDHQLETISASDEDEKTVLDLAGLTHNPEYLKHFQHVYNEWVSAGIIQPSESVLPECFAFQTMIRSSPPLPKDVFARAGYYAFDMSTGVAQHTWKAIIASANLAVKAVIHSTQGNGIRTTVALCRPPGHHCDGHRAGGYCYINNAALAVDAFRKIHDAASTNTVTLQTSHPTSQPRIAILDLDFHHGNGTQEIFYRDPNVFYASIHGQDEFPYYTGFAEEQGAACAPNTNLNLPLPTRSTFSAYLAHLSTALGAITAFHPHFLVVSLGFDTFHLDPLGNFQIDTEDYEVMARTTREGIPRDIPVVILLEGGYAIEHLGKNFISFLKGWEKD